MYALLVNITNYINPVFWDTLYDHNIINPLSVITDSFALDSTIRS